MKDFIKYALYILKFALYILWLLVGGIIFLPLTHAWALDSLEELYTHLIALVIYVALTVFAIFLSNVWESHKKKKKEKERAAYEALYVTQSTLHDERFGDIVYRWDTKKQSLLDASVKLPPFAGYTVELSAESGDGMNEAAIAAYIPAAFAAVYDRQQEILPGLCAVVKETYDDEGIQDAAGNPVEEAFIKEHLSVDGLRLYFGADVPLVEVTGSMDPDFKDHIAEHGVTARLNCITGVCEYYSG